LSNLVLSVSTVVGCRPNRLVDCAVNVVSEQCGEEIAGQLRTLGRQLLVDMDCGCRNRKRQ